MFLHRADLAPLAKKTEGPSLRGNDMTEQSELDEIKVPLELMERIWRVFMGYANESAYEADRIGGVLAGCPRGSKPSPRELTFGARIMLKEIQKVLYPDSKKQEWLDDYDLAQFIEAEVQRRIEKIMEGNKNET